MDESSIDTCTDEGIYRIVRNSQGAEYSAYFQNRKYYWLIVSRVENISGTSGVSAYQEKVIQTVIGIPPNSGEGASDANFQIQYRTRYISQVTDSLGIGSSSEDTGWTAWESVLTWSDLEQLIGTSSVSYSGNNFYAGDSNKVGTKGFKIIDYSGAHGTSGTYTLEGTSSDYERIKSAFDAKTSDIKLTIVNIMMADSYSTLTGVSYSGNGIIVVNVDNIYTNSYNPSYVEHEWSANGFYFQAYPELGYTIQRRTMYENDLDTSDKYKNQACLFVCGYPELGTFGLFENATAFGSNNISQGEGSFNAGEGNQALGKFSSNHGKNNKSGYDSHNFGRENDNSFAQEVMAFGFRNKVTDFANRVVQFGQNLFSKFSNQYQFGYFNENKEENLIEVGNGTGEDARHNALELDRKGNMSLEGVLYTGPNKDEVSRKALNSRMVLRNRGVWNSTKQYEAGDIVTAENGDSYLATHDNFNTPIRGDAPYPQYVCDFRNAWHPSHEVYGMNYTTAYCPSYTTESSYQRYLELTANTANSDVYVYLKKLPTDDANVRFSDCKKIVIGYRSAVNCADQPAALFSWSKNNSSPVTVQSAATYDTSDNPTGITRSLVIDATSAWSGYTDDDQLTLLRFDYFNYRPTIQKDASVCIRWIAFFPASADVSNLPAGWEPDWMKISSAPNLERLDNGWVTIGSASFAGEWHHNSASPGSIDTSYPLYIESTEDLSRFRHFRYVLKSGYRVHVYLSHSPEETLVSTRATFGSVTLFYYRDETTGTSQLYTGTQDVIYNVRQLGNDSAGMLYICAANSLLIGSCHIEASIPSSGSGAIRCDWEAEFTVELQAR